MIINKLHQLHNNLNVFTQARAQPNSQTDSRLDKPRKIIFSYVESFKKDKFH